MTKSLLTILAIISLLALSAVTVTAQSERGQGNSRNQNLSDNLSPTPTETEDEDNDQDNEDTAENEGNRTGQPKATASRSEKAIEHMSAVAKFVEQLLTNPERKGGIGEQVREVAKAQNQAQEEIREQISLIEARRGWLEKLIGPDQEAVKNVRQELLKNSVRIRQLENLQGKITNQQDLALIEDTIQALKTQNATLQEEVLATEKKGSLFGWLLRLINR